MTLENMWIGFSFGSGVAAGVCLILGIAVFGYDAYVQQKDRKQWAADVARRMGAENFGRKFEALRQTTPTWPPPTAGRIEEGDA